MSTFSYPLEVGDLAGQHFERIEALVDTGASFSVVPASLLERLGISPTGPVEFELGDGHVVTMDVGQAWVRIDGESAIRRVVFAPEGTPSAIGSDTLQGLLLMVDPIAERLIPRRALLR